MRRFIDEVFDNFQIEERPEGKFEVIDGNTRCKIFMDIFAFLEEKRDLPKTFRRITQTDYTEHIEWIEETFNNNSNVAFRADFDNAMGSCSTLAKLKVICIPEDFDTKHEMKVVKLIPSHISSRSSGVTFLEAVMIVREMLLSVIFPNSKPESRHTQMSKMGKFTTFHVMALLGFEHDYISKMGNAVRFLLLLSKADFEYLLKIFDSMIHTPLDLVGRVRFAVKGDAEIFYDWTENATIWKNAKEYVLDPMINGYQWSLYRSFQEIQLMYRFPRKDDGPFYIRMYRTSISELLRKQKKGKLLPEDSQRLLPSFYITGYQATELERAQLTSIYNFDLTDVVSKLQRMIDGDFRTQIRTETPLPIDARSALLVESGPSTSTGCPPKRRSDSIGVSKESVDEDHQKKR
ncbi:hypothetical protein QR680_012739 [Steinernema hermaphroditum]|uniref:Uncharacterized protein n=1 Tax=Steinernema hermaphroditum TaxID=289476 RepID=A0AA39M0B5_9BILA|nr:hypothetical protein QR680_012739 [Steinernema hermaphroditum]